MEQFRQIGEALGSVKAWMVFEENIQINKRQCCVLVEMLSCTYQMISEEMKHNLRFEDMKQMKWKVLEQPLKDLLRVFKEAELYIKQCLLDTTGGDNNHWWAKVLMSQNTDCVHLHIHNLYCCIPVIVEAIENVITATAAPHDHHHLQAGAAGEEDEMKRMVYANKYLQREWKDPKLFQWKFGKQYLVTPHLCTLLDSAWREDRWILINKLRDKTRPSRKRITSSSTTTTTKFDRKMADAILPNLEEDEEEDEEEEEGSESSSWKWRWKKKKKKKKLLPSSLFVGYQVRRRLGTGRQYKEISWLGESFALRHVTSLGSGGGGDEEEFKDELVSAAAVSHCCGLSHPNIINTLCCFMDEEKRECFILMELMTRDLSSHIKEMCGPRKRIVPFSLPVTVDIMLQIARGMEYLHSNNIYHGDLNPSNVLVKPRSSEPGYLLVKVTGFGAFKSSSSSNSIIKMKPSSSSNNSNNSQKLSTETPSFIWHAPEVLTEQDETCSSSSSSSSKYSLEKCDVYSFGMICFELLTGKVPFEDTHLQGDKMGRNIRAGERPLFPYPSSNAKYLTNLTKRCWHTEPNQRPTFTSICRILRYVKRFLMMNPHSDHHHPPPPTTTNNSTTSHTDPQPMPSTDYCEIESRLTKLVFPSAAAAAPAPSSSHKWNHHHHKDIHVYDIPFQMFMYMAVEKEKTSANLLFIRDINNSESGSEGTASICGDVDTLSLVDEPLPPHHLPLQTERKLSLSPENPSKNHLLLLKRSPDRLSRHRPAAATASPHRPARSSVVRPPHIVSRSMRLISNRDISNPKMRRSASYSHASDSELP